MRYTTDDLRIKEIRELTPPAHLIREFPCEEVAADTVHRARLAAHDILHGNDDRLIVVVGPCSIHDPKAAREYAEKLAEVRRKLQGELEIIMRVYFEKPRTTVGWKGLINDPDMDGSCRINHGLRIARELILDINNMGLPTGVEYLDMITPQYIADLVSWGAIGARTTESQVHRELASGLSMPVGFKNGTSGSLQIAVDAIVSSSCPHCFLSVTKQGVSAIVSTTGNKSCHLILRGSSLGPNFDEDHVKEAEEALQKAGINNRIMIDCSHGNSCKDYRKQPAVAANIAEQISSGSEQVVAVMIESNIVEGAQPLSSDLVYGKSITDQCIGWETTVEVLETLAAAVRKRRAKRQEA